MASYVGEATKSFVGADDSTAPADGVRLCMNDNTDDLARLCVPDKEWLVDILNSNG